MCASRASSGRAARDQCQAASAGESLQLLCQCGVEALPLRRQLQRVDRLRQSSCEMTTWSPPARTKPLSRASSRPTMVRRPSGDWTLSSIERGNGMRATARTRTTRAASRGRPAAGHRRADRRNRRAARPRASRHSRRATSAMNGLPRAPSTTAVMTLPRGRSPAASVTSRSISLADSGRELEADDLRIVSQPVRQLAERDDDGAARRPGS